jgi:signal transduction histidine kinase
MSVAFAAPPPASSTTPDLISLERDLTRLRQGGHYLKTALDQISEGVLILMPEQDGRPPYIMHGNARAHLLVCADPNGGLREKTLDDLAANEASALALREMMERAQSQGGFAACRCELRTGPRGVPQWFDWRARAVTNEHGGLLNHTLCFNPVEEKPLPAEEDFDAQAERLRIVNLAAQAQGIAHDVNNLLGPMMTQLSLTLQRVRGQAELESDLQMMFASLKRAKQFTQQVLRSTRANGQSRAPTDMLELVRDTVAVCAAGGSVEVSIGAEENLMWACANATHMSQVVQNLIMNGIQAMPGGGRLSIELATTQLLKGNAEGMTAGAYVEIRVRDRGTGMTEETRSRLFKEAFTTKHDGNGIGLTTCHRYIQEHGGRILVNSTLNIGTEFRLLLPAVEPQSRAGSGRSTGPIPLQHGKGRVLLVDDEEALRHVARRILDRCGFEVIEAGKWRGSHPNLQRERSLRPGSGRGFDGPQPPWRIEWRGDRM